MTRRRCQANTPLLRANRGPRSWPQHPRRVRRKSTSSTPRVSAYRLPRDTVDSSASAQPRPPHEQTGPSAERITCPASPMQPCAIRSSLPSTTMPTPRPVPPVRQRKREAPRPSPNTYSARAAAFESASTWTRRPNSAASRAPIGASSSHGRFGLYSRDPSARTKPATATEAPATGTEDSTRNSPHTATTLFRKAAPLGATVGNDRQFSISPLWLTRASLLEEPPMSIAMIFASSFLSLSAINTCSLLIAEQPRNLRSHLISCIVA